MGFCLDIILIQLQPQALFSSNCLKTNMDRLYEIKCFYINVSILKYGAVKSLHIVGLHIGAQIIRNIKNFQSLKLMFILNTFRHLFTIYHRESSNIHKIQNTI